MGAATLWDRALTDYIARRTELGEHAPPRTGTLDIVAAGPKSGVIEALQASLAGSRSHCAGVRIVFTALGVGDATATRDLLKAGETQGIAIEVRRYPRHHPRPLPDQLALPDGSTCTGVATFDAADLVERAICEMGALGFESLWGAAGRQQIAPAPRFRAVLRPLAEFRAA